MGDVAISAPLVKAYAKHNPECKFFMLSQPRHEAMFKGVDNLFFIPIVIKRNAATSAAYQGGFRTLMKIGPQLLRQYSITDVADIHNVLRTKVLRLSFFGRVSKCKVIDKHRRERKELTRKQDKILQPITSSQRCMEEVFVKLGFDDIHFASAGCAPSIEHIERKHKADNDGVTKIGIAPFAGHKGKTWPVSKMEEVVKRLSSGECSKILNSVAHNSANSASCRADSSTSNTLEREKSIVYLFGGGAKEIAVLKEWASKYPNTELVAGLHSLDDELKTIGELDIMVSMDSANMHLASLVGVPVVSVWGATHPYAGCYGYRQNLNNAVQVEMSCRPCSIYGAKVCARGDYACLENISPDMVIEKIKKVLEK